MKLSVALCVYNGEKYLNEQLESIERQERIPDEVIISDDGSTDRSMTILEDFAARSPFPVQIHRNESNLGVTRNFEQTIGRCRGDLIATADQDDVWYPIKLSRIESEFERSPDLGLVFTDADLIDGSSKLLGSRLWPAVRFDEKAQLALNQEKYFRVLLRRPVITGATMAFRAELRPLVFPILPGWLHDEWIGLMVAAASRLRAIPEPLMMYRLHSQNHVGVSPEGVADRVKLSLGRSRRQFLCRARDFEAMRDCLLSRQPGRLDLREQIDQKIDHLRVRGSLPDQRLFRLPGIVRELTTHRYSRYSGHVLGFARDLLSSE